MLEYNCSTLTINDIPPDRSGYVYLIRAEGTDRYKIGRSVNPVARHQTLTKQSPYPLRIAECFWTPDCISDERFLHETLASYRVFGEWFEFDSQYYWGTSSGNKDATLEFLTCHENFSCDVRGSYALSRLAYSSNLFIKQEHEKHNADKEPIDFFYDISRMYLYCKDVADLSRVHKFIYDFMPDQIEMFKRTAFGEDKSSRDFIDGAITGFSYTFIEMRAE